jgi:hypothetical protein
VIRLAKNKEVWALEEQQKGCVLSDSEVLLIFITLDGKIL